MTDAERRAREDYMAELAEMPNYPQGRGKHKVPRPPWDGLPSFAKATRIRLAERELWEEKYKGRMQGDN
jgi:hypothetical protein